MKLLIPILIGLLVVGCGKENLPNLPVAKKVAPLKKKASGVGAVAWVSDPNDPNNVKIETAIRRQINKPTGELTKVDSEKVTILSLRSNQLTDVKGLEKLAKLEVLFLANNQLTDVKGLEKLSQLIGVDLSDNPDLTRTQIAELQKALPNCDITSNPSLTKEESAKIIEAEIREYLEKPTGKLTKENLEKVEGLFLRDHRLTDVTSLEKLTQLTNLNLRNNRLTDLKGLERLTQLKDLDLFDNQLTDMKGIEKLTQLTSLNLGNNRLTDVKGLENLKRLEFLSLHNNTALIKAQIAELRRALPECEIITP